MENQASSLSTRLEQPPRSDSESRVRLIREWLFRFALNCGETLSPDRASGLVTLWSEGFADVAPGRLQAAFVSCIRAHRFPKMPTVADIRSHLTKAEEGATNLEAERKWEQVLRYAQSTSPDYPARPVRIKDQTQAAIRAAGGLDWIRDCPSDDLQWAKKRFLESFTSWNALEKNQFLLPDGDLKTLIAGAAEKLLPGAKP